MAAVTEGGAYVIGVDIGQMVDPTAACVLERQIQIVERGFDEPEHREHYFVRALRRWPLKTSYDSIVADIGSLVRTPSLRDALIAVDVTGPGRVAGSIFEVAHREDRLSTRWPWLFTITGQQTPTQHDHIRKLDLVQTTLIAFDRRRIHVAPHADYADVLLRELEGYTARTTASGISIFENGSRDSPHDDLLFSLMLALFVAPRSGPMEDCRVFKPKGAEQQ